jgi:predicted lipid-binding transport protein (Tim44 family)
MARRSLSRASNATIGLKVLEIVLLAMVAAFLGLRLYSVLGRRAEQEEEPAVQRFESDDAPAIRPAAMPAAVPAARPAELEGVMPAVERGLREIAAADSQFNLAQFLDGARGAYRMILEAFWKGDRETLRELCDDDVYAGFTAALDAREAAGETMDNSLIRIEEVRIHSAALDGKMARIALLFVADIASVTRDKEGTVIAGSLDDAIESRDVWTFSRNITARDPNWLLDETDEG